MKLISCYIENFGGLSQYTLDFSEGVTVIQQPNGFGKTTLAEFLRAMFYGFPRKAKTLDKSRRQKYTPWNGGKFGGNLVFEYEGVRYRLERTFGATPRSDTFRLTDLSTNRKSDRFSEEIGLELFQLDSDSFERSTYMPQLHEAVTLTTTGIQAKLGDLVEDAGDLGNYDKAVLALKARRSSFVPYKGSSGSVAEAAANVTRLQRELDLTEAKKQQLALGVEDLANLEGRLERKKEEYRAVEQQKELAAAAEKRKLLRGQLEDLTFQHGKAEEILSRLEEAYPGGIPGPAELDEMEELANQLAVLTARQVTTSSDLEAEEFLKANEFRFASGVPQADELEIFQNKCEDFNALNARLENLGLTGGEEKQYRSLKAVAETGLLEEGKLDDLAQQNRLLMTRLAALDSLTVSEEDRQQMKLLGEFFAEGVPSEAQIDAQMRNLARCEALRQENAQLAASRKPVPKKPGSGNVKPVLLLSGVGIVVGILLLILGKWIPGGILLGVGIPGMIAAVLLKKKHDAAVAVWQAWAEADAEIQDKLDANEAEAAGLYRQARMFAGDEPLSEGLARIRRNLDSFLFLREKVSALREKRSVLAGQIDAIDSDLAQILEPVFGSVSDYDKAISQLRLARGQYLDLSRKKEEAEAECAGLAQQAGALRRELTAFGLEDGQFSQSLAALRRDAERYSRAKEQVSQWQQRRARHEQALADIRRDLQTICDGFGLIPWTDLRRQIRQLREDAKTHRDALAQEKQLHRQIVQFRAEHMEALGTDEPEQEFDREQLKWTADRISGEISHLTRSQVEREQQIAKLRDEIDRIPQIRDELDYWQEKRIADQKKADTLDSAMDFLAKARDSLTTSYLGPIRENFESLLRRLMDMDQKVFISPDLDVQLERYGQVRELGYFSAGQTDMIVLSMRFALVDALFGEAKPFVILDDPFVNLDDQRTARALELLQELGGELQIIYLTCSSSRTL